MKTVDLFAGCGGSSCGLMQAGLEVVAMVEFNCTAALTYMTNLCRYGEFQIHFITKEDEDRMEREIEKEHAHNRKNSQKLLRAGTGWIKSQPNMKGCRHVIIGDIRRLPGSLMLHWIGMERGELDHMCMSPPCQGFSTANTKRDKTYVLDPRNDLCFEAARLIVECSPRTISLENVPGFQKSPQLAMFKTFLSGGEESVRVFDQLLLKHPHWQELLAIGETLQAIKERISVPVLVKHAA